MERNAKPSVDRPIFENFIRHQLISQTTALRTNPYYSKAEALLLMDNCSAHVNPEKEVPQLMSEEKSVKL
jgi:hypothetical protein